jgi:predicted 3-demethylubiquinone-9 3-methyltransferase (glyoxalase superfamily)
MEKITPHPWFDKEAKEAARSYTYVFKELITLTWR